MFAGRYFGRVHFAPRYFPTGRMEEAGGTVGVRFTARVAGGRLARTRDTRRLLVREARTARMR